MLICDYNEPFKNTNGFIPLNKIFLFGFMEFFLSRRIRKFHKSRFARSRFFQYFEKYSGWNSISNYKDNSSSYMQKLSDSFINAGFQIDIRSIVNNFFKQLDSGNVEDLEHPLNAEIYREVVYHLIVTLFRNKCLNYKNIVDELLSGEHEQDIIGCILFGTISSTETIKKQLKLYSAKEFRMGQRIFVNPQLALDESSDTLYFIDGGSINQKQNDNVIKVSDCSGLVSYEFLELIEASGKMYDVKNN